MRLTNKEKVRIKMITRLGLDGAWSTCEYCVYPVMMLIATPLLIRGLGMNAYGEWMLGIAISALGGLINLGMGAALTREIACYNENDLRKCDFAGIGVASLAATASWSIFTLILVLVVHAQLQISGDLIGGVMDIKIYAYASLLALCEQIDTIYSGSLRGLERFSLLAKIESVTRVSGVCLLIFMALRTQSLIMILVASISSALIRTVLKGIYVGNYCGLSALKPKWCSMTFKRLFSFGKWNLTQNLGSMLFALSDKIIIGSYLGYSALTIYSLALQIAQQLHAVPSAFLSILFPHFSKFNKSDCEGDKKQVHMVRLVTVVLFGTLAAISIVMLLVIKTVLISWVGVTMAKEALSVTQLLIVSYWILGTSLALHYYHNAIGNAKQVAIANSTAGLISIIFASIAIQHIGVIGGAFGRLGYSLCLIAMLSRIQSRRATFSDKPWYISMW